MREIPLEHLEARGLIEPVRGVDDERYWLDCDLASLAEHRIGDATDPRELTDARRDEWARRVTLEGPSSIEERNEYGRCCWLREGAERVGTVALSRTVFGGADARLSSLYVFPSKRGGGVGRRALERIAAALGERRFGYRLDTCWTWQRTVRFYLRTGHWIYMWKRDLTFRARHGAPRPILDVSDDAVTLSAEAEGRRAVLAVARTTGGRLEIDEPPPDTWKNTPFEHVAWEALSTLSLALALEGRPLVRSPRHREDLGGADGGPPEALAQRIEVWEAFDRARGWTVETPRIPGLAYPTWAELEARWDAEDADP